HANVTSSTSDHLVHHQPHTGLWWQRSVINASDIKSSTINASKLFRCLLSFGGAWYERA
ncbi:hypothetical protein PoB_003956700, partial [Plakobranchus ocellatus]